MEVLRVRLGAEAEIGDALRAVRDDARPFALIGRWGGSRAIVGSEPVRVVEGPAGLDVLDAAPVESEAGVVGGGGSAIWASAWGRRSRSGVLVMPPADGRILPGITRRRMLEHPEVATEVRPIASYEARAAPAMVLTSSRRVVTPAGVQEPPSHAARDLAERLVHSLNRSPAHCCA